MRYLTDGKRHLICTPYSIGNLHSMAQDLGINRCWYHAGRLPHYDVPKLMHWIIKPRTQLVSTRDIIKIIKEGLNPGLLNRV